MSEVENGMTEGGSLNKFPNTRHSECDAPGINSGQSPGLNFLDVMQAARLGPTRRARDEVFLAYERGGRVHDKGVAHWSRVLIYKEAKRTSK